MELDRVAVFRGEDFEFEVCEVAVEAFLELEHHVFVSVDEDDVSGLEAGDKVAGPLVVRVG